MSAGELAAQLRQAPSTLSFHLSALELAGLVHSTRQGRHVIYAVRLAGLRSLFGFLTETCCNGRPELCGDLLVELGGVLAIDLDNSQDATNTSIIDQEVNP